MQHHPRLGTSHGEHPRVYPREQVDVIARVRDDYRFARRAGRCVQAHTFLARDGQEPKGIRVPQIRLAREGEAAEILERADLGYALQTVAIERHTLAQIRDEPVQSLELERLELGAWHRLERGLEDHRRWEKIIPGPGASLVGEEQGPPDACFHAKILPESRTLDLGLPEEIRYFRDRLEIGNVGKDVGCPGPRD